ncbi:TPA: hypothetical protein NJ211_004679 [Vibrio parahaemolyticus]|nr:hypothetical protein [Vibrio parahaemolyticus]HCG6702079.1 hypothetical protein [Vibrio parahaemolyticus]HCG6712593.1 hypothetical protein [Vibrio parahaemolyticus]
MGKLTMNKLFRILATACYLATWSGLAQGAQYTIPVGLLYYTPGAGTSNYVFPRSGTAGSALCSENTPYGKLYNVVGQYMGNASWWFTMRVNEPAIVTLYEREGRGTAQLKVTPLGMRRTASKGYRGGSVWGSTCREALSFSNSYAEKSIGSNGAIEMMVKPGYGTTLSYTLAFELLNPNSVIPGIYSARGGYQFSRDEIEMSDRTDYNGPNGSKTTPYIPNLSLVVGHVFKIDMPHTSVSLSPSYEDDDTFTGEVRFRAQSNERYSITMQCGNSNATTPEGNCYFASTQMELATQARFTEQNKSYPLRHGIPAYIDGADFTGSIYEYPGYIDFTLSKIREHGETGKTYFDIVSLTFEADF